MKKILCAIVITTLFSCSSDDSEKQTLDDVNTNAIQLTVNWLENHENGEGKDGAKEFLKKEIDKCLATPSGNGYDFFNIYVGSHPHNQTFQDPSSYESENTVIMVFFSENHNKEIRIYKPNGKVLTYTDELNKDKFIANDIVFYGDFSNNKFIGSVVKEAFFKI